MTRLITLTRCIALVGLLASLAGCASLYGKGKDAGSNRLGRSAAPGAMDVSIAPAKAR